MTIGMTNGQWYELCWYQMSTQVAIYTSSAHLVSPNQCFHCHSLCEIWPTFKIVWNGHCQKYSVMQCMCMCRRWDPGRAEIMEEGLRIQKWNIWIWVLLKAPLPKVQNLSSTRCNWDFLEIVHHQIFSLYAFQMIIWNMDAARYSKTHRNSSGLPALPCRSIICSCWPICSLMTLHWGVDTFTLTWPVTRLWRVLAITPVLRFGITFHHFLIEEEQTRKMRQHT